MKTRCFDTVRSVLLVRNVFSMSEKARVIMKDICKRGKRTPNQKETQNPKIQPERLQGQSTVCCPWRAGEPLLAPGHRASPGQRALPRPGWGFAVTTETPLECHVPCRLPVRSTGGSRLGENPSWQLEVQAGWHRAVPASPRG